MNTAASLIIGVTSHRNIPAGETAAIQQRVRELFAHLQHEFPHSPLTVLSPLAEGGDQLVAEEALRVGSRLIAPLPLARNLYTRDFTDVAVREHFEALCAQAQVIELPLSAGYTQAEVAVNGEPRNHQYAQAGMFVARHCHLLLAIWDGKPSGRTGGTAQIVDYFLTGAPPGRIGPRRDTRPNLYGSGIERLLCHLVCSRDVPDGAPAAPLKPGQIVWRDADDRSAPDASMPPSVHAVFAQAEEFNRDAAAYAKRIAASQTDVDGATATDDAGPAQTPPAALFHAADWLANHFQRRVLLALRVLYSVAFLMGMAFTTYDNVADEDNMLYVFLFLFVAGVVVSVVAKRRGWHRKYLDYRALAEGLRVQGYWLRAGLALDGAPGTERDSPTTRQEAELAWVRNVMRSTGLAAALGPGGPDGAALPRVIEEWVGDPDHGELGYYHARTRQREHAHHVNQVLGTTCLIIGILIAIMMAVRVHQLSFEAKNTWIVIMSMFSIFAAVREAYSFRKADRELIRQYRFMERVFRNARKALAQAQNADQQREILRALGEAALAEHVEWAGMHRQRPLEAGKM